MGSDEEGTLAALKSHRRELIDPLITQHQGRIVKTTGDGMLIEFASVVDAVRCAVVVQRGMEDRNANIPEGQRIRFRIGINLGDIIIDDGDIFGDGVNVAARLEALAEPGEICVSASVREQVGELGFAGDVERAIEWGERGLRLSPLDPWSFVACHGMFLAHFQTGRFEQAANAARKSVQHNPGFSISHMFLAAALGKLGRMDEAKAAASRVLALQPGFSIAEWCAATDPVPAIAVPLSDALRAAGLPE